MKNPIPELIDDKTYETLSKKGFISDKDVEAYKIVNIIIDCKKRGMKNKAIVAEVNKIATRKYSRWAHLESMMTYRLGLYGLTVEGIYNGE